jgi:hypothetical protein
MTALSTYSLVQGHSMPPVTQVYIDWLNRLVEREMSKIQTPNTHIMPIVFGRDGLALLRYETPYTLANLQCCCYRKTAANSLGHYCRRKAGPV